MRPEASPAAEELYAALAPVQEAADEASGQWIGLKACMALTAGKIDLLHSYLIDDEQDAPAWAIIFDPLRCPVEALPFLAQFDGAVIRPSMSEEEVRDAIRQPQAFQRGTVAQIEAICKRSLTGTKTVVVTERYTGDPWKLRVETLASETPDQARLKAELIEEAKPIGILLFFNTRVAWTWGEVKAESSTYPTWKKVKELFPTWKDFRTHEA
jgi:hypothetical protein